MPNAPAAAAPHRRWAVAAAVLLGAAAGCQSSYRPPPDEHTLAVTPAQGATLGRSTFELAVPIPGHDACLVPFVVEMRRPAGDSDPFTRGGFTMQSVASLERSSTDPRLLATDWLVSTRWHNAVIVGTASGAQRPILEDRGLISQVRWIGARDEHGALVRADLLLFTVTTSDSNADGALNDLDANHIVLATPDGSRIEAVTPAGAQVWGARHDAQTGRLYFRILFDTTGDGAFTDADSAQAYFLDPARDGAARPLVDGAVRESLESMVR